MNSKRKTRRYNAPLRHAHAEQTRDQIVRAAKELFEERGWAGATIPAISAAAGVSNKTVEAVFGTKAALLRSAVDYAIRGDAASVPMVARESVRRVEAAPDAPSMLRLHAAHLRAINERSARIAWTVEHAAASDPVVESLWQRMNENRAFGVRWAAGTLLGKPGRKPGVRHAYAESVFWVALDWGTYRTLTAHAGLTPRGYESWLRRYYAATLLPGGS